MTSQAAQLFPTTLPQERLLNHSSFKYLSWSKTHSRPRHNLPGLPPPHPAGRWIREQKQAGRRREKGETRCGAGVEMTWSPNHAQPHPVQPRVGPLRAKAKLLSSENFSAVPSTSRFSMEPTEATGLACRNKQLIPISSPFKN